MTDIERILAQAMCGHPVPCGYHVAQAKIAADAIAGAGMVVVPREASLSMRVAGAAALVNWDVVSGGGAEVEQTRSGGVEQ